MKRLFPIFISIFTLLLFPIELIGQSKNGTVQMPNMGFEEWDNLGTDNVEPKGWNSFMTGNASGLLGSGKQKKVDRNADKRPGSKGTYSAQIWSTAILGVKANGNLTTGRINLGSMTPTDGANHNWTIRTDPNFSIPFAAIPDSLVIWLKFEPKSAGDIARVACLIHNNEDVRDPGANNGQIAASAILNYPKTNGWIRFSIPFVKGSSSDPRYMLFSLTTNKTPGEGGEGDRVWMDDLIFIYTPTLSPRTLNTLSYGVAAEAPTSINIPFSITGTMSPNNLDPDNEVRAELSDVNGSFANPLVLGRMTTDESGTIQGEIPAGTMPGTGYKIRLVSTNYPLVSASTPNIEIYPLYRLEATASNHRGSIVGATGYFRKGTEINVTANPKFANHFTHWSENGTVIPKAEANYRFTLNASRSIVAQFDTNSYEIALSIIGEGSVSGYEGAFVHGSTINLRAKANAGYKFVEYTKNGNRITTSPNYSVPITENLSLSAVFKPEIYTITANSSNTNWGTVTGEGSFEYNSNVTLTANPRQYCEFIAWISNTGDTVSKNSTYTFMASKTASFTALFSEVFYNVDCEILPANCGTTTGQGKYSSFISQTITLTATPIDGYQFYRWEKKNTSPIIYDNRAIYPIITNGRIAADAKYIAHFKRIGFDINAVALPSQGGKIEGVENYPFGEMATLIANPNTGYEFIAWEEGENVVSNETTYTFTVSAARNLQALFSLKKYQVKLTSSDNTMGSVRGEGTFEHFNTTKVEALANEGYEFRGWIENGDTISKEAVYIFSLNGNRELKAAFSFKRKKLTLVAAPLGSGRFEGGGIYEHNSVVSLIPEAFKGYEFYAWVSGSDTLSKSKNINILLDRDSTITGCFRPLPYTVKISAIDANGTVSSNNFSNTNPQTAEGILFFGDTVRIKATPFTEGYVFTKWLANGSVVSNDEEYSFVLKENITLVAYFSNRTKLIKVELIPQNMATVTNAGNQEIDNTVVLEVKPKTGYEFVKWTTTNNDSISNEADFGFFHSKDTTFKAYLRLKNYLIDTKVIPMEAGSCSGSDNYFHFDNATLTAQANYGYSFVAWLCGKDTIAKENQMQIEVKDKAVYTAVFKKENYRIQALQHPQEAGAISGEGIYTYKDLCTLTAQPKYGLHFKAWVCGNDTLSKKSTFSFEVNRDSILTAIFDTNLYQIQVLTENNEMGSVGGTGTYLYADSVKLIAQANYGYHFTHWTNAQDQILGEDSCLQLLALRDSSITAHFIADEFTVNGNVDNLNAGSIEGFGSYSYLTKSQLKAVPTYGYRFTKWTSGGTMVSTYPLYELTVTKDTQLIAHFAIDSFYIRTLSNLENAGTVFGEGKYKYDSLIQLSASPIYGYEFSHWSIDGIQVSDNAKFVYRVEKTASLTANFNPRTFFTKTLIENEECGQTEGAGSYTYGSLVKLEAKPKLDFHFVEWRNAKHWVSNDSIFSFNITQDTLFTAVFRTDTFTISAIPNLKGAGNISGNGKFIIHTADTLQAKENKGYRFLYWEKDGNKCSEENPYIFMVEKSINYTAVFERLTYTMTANANPSIGGVVTGTGSYFYGDTAYLEAISEPIYDFREWAFTGESLIEPGESVSNFDTANLRDTHIFFVMKSNVEIQAKFAKKSYAAIGFTSPLEAGEIKNLGNYEYGSTVRLEVSENHGYQFTGWDMDGEQISDSTACEFEITKPSLVIANFVRRRFVVDLKAYPSKAGILSGAGTYLFGDTVIASVVVTENYAFDEWVDDNARTFGTTTKISFIIQDNTYLTALFFEKTGKEENTERANYKLYPNPFNTTLYVQAEGFNRIELYNMMGQKVLECAIDTYKQNLDISHLKSGFFFYRLYAKDGSLRSGKLIKE